MLLTTNVVSSVFKICMSQMIFSLKARLNSRRWRPACTQTAAQTEVEKAHRCKLWLCPKANQTQPHRSPWDLTCLRLHHTILMNKRTLKWKQWLNTRSLTSPRNMLCASCSKSNRLHLLSANSRFTRCICCRTWTWSKTSAQETWNYNSPPTRRWNLFQAVVRPSWRSRIRRAKKIELL